uniref:Putative secreted protein n=1 Tax=Anopheles marajoara TaxID=58244 RepID=A0A2M4CD86_9DIPT
MSRTTKRLLRNCCILAIVCALCQSGSVDLIAPPIKHPLSGPQLWLSSLLLLLPPRQGFRHYNTHDTAFWLSRTR